MFSELIIKSIDNIKFTSLYVQKFEDLYDENFKKQDISNI